MSDAKQRKDIMDELLSDSKAHGYIRQKELDELPLTSLKVFQHMVSLHAPKHQSLLTDGH